MSDAKRSRAALLEFLDYLSAKGLMNQTTARSRKASAKAVLSVLDDDEAADVSKLNLDDVMARFNNLHASEFTPGSLGTYRSRTKSAVEDFLRYQQNPLAFRASTPNGTRKTRQQIERPKAQDASEGPEAPAIAKDASYRPAATDNIFPVPLRSNLTIYIQGLPHDLTPAEGRKVANIILAMVTPTAE